MTADRKGFTFIELVTAMVILSIMAAAGSFILVYLVQSAVFMPNQLGMDMLAADALDSMIEGDPQAGGLRFSRAVTRARAYAVTFRDQDDRRVRYRLNRRDNKLYRSVQGGAEQLLPYYAHAGVSILGENDRLFTYYDAQGAETNRPADVRWITMTLTARTGSGSFSAWEGESRQSSSVAVQRYYSGPVALDLDFLPVSFP